MQSGKLSDCGIAVLVLCLVSTPMSHAQAPPPAPAPVHHPWDDSSLPPDQRADLVLKEMTLDEKIQLVHGTGWGALRPGDPIPAGSNWGAGFIPGIERLGIPGINQQDSAVGVRLSALMGRYSTLLPSTLGTASSWDVEGARLYGHVIGRELRAQGFNMSIGGGVDITRDPRNGRNFEYAGEDPLLAGTLVGNLMQGVQAEHVMGDVKHYAFNDQETGRNILSAVISHRAARESDLLAFQIAIGIARPAGIMCSYNRVNGDYACENDWLLNQVLKRDFGFKGWVLSDWGGTHSTVKAALAGLDQDMPGDDGYFGDALRQAVEHGEVPLSRLEDMDHRILRSMFAAGVIDHPVLPRDVLDPFKGRDDAQHIAAESIVLLRNEGGILPLDAGSSHSIAVIGSHADVGVLSGGGSAQVDVPGGNAVGPHPGGAHWQETVYFPAAPLQYLRAHALNAKVEFNPGIDAAAAAAFAASADVAIVFVNQPMHEDMDRPTLSLPEGQDALVAAVAAANPHTIVVLETGGPVSMPWAQRVQGIVEAWYPGAGGAAALADLLFGTVNFSAKLPVSFAKQDADLPHPEVTGMNLKPVPQQLSFTHDGHTVTRTITAIPPFDVDYGAGAAVGYKWFESQHIQPLFPFGFGLSYTTFSYSHLRVDGAGHTATLTVGNTGRRAGTEVAEVYARLPAAAGEHYLRLVAFDRVALAPGESKTITLELNPACLSVFNERSNTMEEIPGRYEILAGPSAADTPLVATFDR